MSEACSKVSLASQASWARLQARTPTGDWDGAAQQELAESVLGAQQVRLGIVASPDQVAQGLVGFVGDPDRREVAAAQQPCQLGRIALVGLDPVAGPGRDERGGTTSTATPARGCDDAACQMALASAASSRDTQGRASPWVSAVRSA